MFGMWEHFRVHDLGAMNHEKGSQRQDLTLYNSKNTSQVFNSRSPPSGRMLQVHHGEGVEGMIDGIWVQGLKTSPEHQCFSAIAWNKDIHRGQAAKVCSGGIRRNCFSPQICACRFSTLSSTSMWPCFMSQPKKLTRRCAKPEIARTSFIVAGSEASPPPNPQLVVILCCDKRDKLHRLTASRRNKRTRRCRLCEQRKF